MHRAPFWGIFWGRELPLLQVALGLGKSRPAVLPAALSPTLSSHSRTGNQLPFWAGRIAPQLHFYLKPALGSHAIDTWKIISRGSRLVTVYRRSQPGSALCSTSAVDAVRGESCCCSAQQSPVYFLWESSLAESNPALCAFLHEGTKSKEMMWLSKAKSWVKVKPRSPWLLWLFSLPLEGSWGTVCWGLNKCCLCSEHNLICLWLVHREQVPWMFLQLITEPASLLLCSCVEQSSPTAGAAGRGSLSRAHSAVTTLQGPMEAHARGEKERACLHLLKLWGVSCATPLGS